MVTVPITVPARYSASATPRLSVRLSRVLSRPLSPARAKLMEAPSMGWPVKVFKVAVSREDIAHDVGAAVAHLAPAGRVGIVGYCWGGLVAWIAAATTPVSAAVAYYGGGIHEQLDLAPVCPVMFHYGEKDPLIPLEVVERVRAACPQGVFHFYPAGHGFNCTDRTDYDADCAQLAFERTLGFLRDHVG